MKKQLQKVGENLRYSEWKEIRGTTDANSQPTTARTESELSSKTGESTISYAEWRTDYRTTAVYKEVPDEQKYNALRRVNASSAETINYYQGVIKNGAYMSETDLKKYRQALYSYSTSGNRLYTYYDGLSGDNSQEDLTQWESRIDTLNKNYDYIEEFYSGFDSEEAYNQSRDQAKQLEGMLAADVTELWGEVEEIKSWEEQYYQNDHQLKLYFLNPGNSGITEQQAEAMDLWLREKEAKYGFEGTNGLKGLISQKTAYIQDVERLQAWDAMEAVSNPDRETYDPMFDNYTGYVSTWVANRETSYFGVDYDAFSGSQAGEANSGYADVTYEYINGNKHISEYLTGIENNYYFLNDRERRIYNYYYATQGRQVAEQYLKLLEDTLNQRAASAEFKKFEGNTVLELVFAVEAGLNQFSSGLTSLSNTEGEYRTPSKTQYLSEMIRADLGKTGPKLPAFLGGASVGQGAYDLITSTANMAPSILATTAVGLFSKTAGTVVGSTLMGASAAGHAYQSKINMGYTKEQAAAYGVLIGASEIALGVVLDAVGDWGGSLTKNAVVNLEKLDDILGKISRNAGAKIIINAGSEAFEEYIQTVLEPCLWEAVSGEVMTVSQEEALYSALLGFLSGGLLESGSTLANTNSRGVWQEQSTRLFDIIEMTGSIALEGKTVDGKKQVQSNTPTLTTQQLLEQSISTMDARPTNPKVYNALRSYDGQLQQCRRTENLLQQERAKLQQQRAEGADPALLRQTEMKIAQLEKLLTKHQEKLHALEQGSILQEQVTKIQNETESQTAENVRNKLLDISAKIDKMKVEGQIIKDGSHIQDGKLKPNVTYQTGEHAYYYMTDSNGLISEVFVEELQEKEHVGRLAHNRNTYGKQEGDHAGHLIGDRFGGSPALDNLVSQAAKVNLSKYKAIEDQWVKALKEGKKVSVRISINYDGGMRPVSFDVWYQIGNKKVSKYIENS